MRAAAHTALILPMCTTDSPPCRSADAAAAEPRPCSCPPPLRHPSATSPRSTAPPPNLDSPPHFSPTNAHSAIHPLPLILRPLAGPLVRPRSDQASRLRPLTTPAARAHVTPQEVPSSRKRERRGQETDTSVRFVQKVVAWAHKTPTHHPGPRLHRRRLTRLVPALVPSPWTKLLGPAK